MRQNRPIHALTGIAMSTSTTSTATLYADHLATLTERATAALARGGFDHLVIPSGTLHHQVFDDRVYDL